MTQTAPGRTQSAHNKKIISSPKKMLEDPDIRIWYDNLARGSPLTAETHLKKLRRFCVIAGTHPEEIIKLGESDWKRVANMISDCITWMEKDKYSPGYINEIRKSVMSWLAHFGVSIPRKIKVRRARTTPTIQDERVPDTDEMARIYDCCPGSRERALIAMISGSGARLEVFGNYDGTDGLRLRDMPDVAIRDGRAECAGGRPCAVVVRPELSKGGHQYFSYIGEFAMNMLLGYLNDRAERGEQLSPDSAAIAPNSSYQKRRGRNSGKAFLTTDYISKRIRGAILKAFGNDRKLRPYAMRAFFDTRLLIAESRGLLAHDFRVFWMGHVGSMEARYTTNKGALPDDLLEEMRAAYHRSEHVLVPAGVAAPKEPKGDDAKGNNAPGEDGRDDDPDIGPGDVTVDVRPEGNWPPYGYVATRPQQKAVNADEAGRLINHGWRFVQELSNGLVIVEAPSISHDDNSMAA